MLAKRLDCVRFSDAFVRAKSCEHSTFPVRTKKRG